MVFIGLGSNLGDRRKAIERALEMLDAHSDVSVLRVSELVETEPFGKNPQPDFLNGVAEIATNLEPERLLEVVKDIERDLGRQERERWGPREVDLDILLWGDRVYLSPKLQIPHPGIAEREFVLRPLAELAPKVVHPVLGMTAEELLERLTGKGPDKA